jgi:ATP-dependent Clp protease ATP-binding subunit ClpA
MPAVTVEELLAQQVRGQSHAVGAVARTLSIAAAGLTRPDRPLSVLLLTGPTGVGKTSMVRAVAAQLRGIPDDFCRIDMSSLAQEHYAASFSGAPPGYAGSKEGHSLFDRDRIDGNPMKPGIVLFDEVEKAHPVVLRALLGVLDSGVLRLSAGTGTIDFRNCHVFMTSNLGSRSLLAQDNRLRLRRPRRSPVEAAVKSFFEPEFLNRIDEVIEFRPLTPVVAAEIVDIEIARIAATLRRRNIHMTISAEARKALIDNGFDRHFGARSLHRSVRTLLLGPLAEVTGDAGGPRLAAGVAVDVARDGTFVCHCSEDTATKEDRTQKTLCT